MVFLVIKNERGYWSILIYVVNFRMRLGNHAMVPDVFRHRKMKRNVFFFGRCPLLSQNHWPPQIAILKDTAALSTPCSTRYGWRRIAHASVSVHECVSVSLSVHVLLLRSHRTAPDWPVWLHWVREGKRVGKRRGRSLAVMPRGSRSVGSGRKQLVSPRPATDSSRYGIRRWDMNRQ
jgi:hypothetical protein